MKVLTTKSDYRVFQVLSGKCNVFLLSNGKNAILIDAGSPRGSKKLSKRLAKLNTRRIDLLILTHAHYDHAGCAAWIKETFQARVMVHRSEASMLEEGLNPEFPNGTMFFPRIIVGLIKNNFHPVMHFPPCHPDILVDARYDLGEFGFNVCVMHTPGHTEGSISVIVDDEIAFVGDTMFGIFGNSIFPPFGGDTEMIVKSWGRLLETGCRLFLPSHGRPNKRELVLKCYKKRTKSPA